MKFKIEIDCDNAAFGDDNWTRCEELRTIIDKRLKEWRHRVGEINTRKIPLYDSNGNRVGFAKFTKGGEA